MRNPKFKAQLAEMGALHESKNRDYASDGNPYSNFEEAAQVAAGFSGVDAVFATLIGVKLARLRELTRAGKQPNHEGIQDTRTDLAMYATLWASYHVPGRDIRTAETPPTATIIPSGTIAATPAKHDAEVVAALSGMNTPDPEDNCSCASCQNPH